MAQPSWALGVPGKEKPETVTEVSECYAISLLLILEPDCRSRFGIISLSFHSTVNMERGSSSSLECSWCANEGPWSISGYC